MLMIDEEDQNLNCPKDSVECASRQSCAALSNHAFADKPTELRKKCQVLQRVGQATIMRRITDRIARVTKSFDEVLIGVVQGLQSTMPARSIIFIVYCH
jgi:hypothetical protein